LLDGHTRIKICRENHLPDPELTIIELPDRAAAREWIISQQLNRRNLGTWWIAYFRGSMYNMEKGDPHRPELHQNDGVTGSTAEKIAEQTGSSPATVERHSRFAQAIDNLKAVINPEFGKNLLDRKYRLSMEDVVTLARKSQEDIKAIAGVLEANPGLSLSEAELLILPASTEETDANAAVIEAATDTSQPAAPQATQAPAPTTSNPPDEAEPSATAEMHEVQDAQFNSVNSQLPRLCVVLMGINRINHPEYIANMRSTLDEMLGQVNRIEEASRS
jgi:hypothetical protein